MKLRGRARSKVGRLTKKRAGAGKTAFLQLWFCFEIGFYPVVQVTCWLPMSSDFPVSVSQVWEL